MADLVSVPTDGGNLPVHLELPTRGRGPVVVVVQEIYGVTDYVRARARDLADLGYVTLAPDVYWRLEDARIDAGSPDALTQARAVVSRLDWDAAVQDVAAVVRFGRTFDGSTGGVGLLGFCFGGSLAFATAAVAQPDVLVSYYASQLPRQLDLAPRVTMPSLHHIGEADPVLPPDRMVEVQAVLSKQENVTIRTYPGAGHAFDNPNPAVHFAEAAAAAWQATVEFLAEHLPVSSTRSDRPA